jgi:coniferyl-aldehyde dehydrogenase
MFGKTLNAGQICLAPDYVVVHKDQKDDFIQATKNAVTEYFPNLKDNDDYTSIINEKHYDRLKDLLDDAIEKGATVDEINPANEDFTQQEFYKMPPTIVTNTTDDMKIMQEEIFGPILPVVEYDQINEATHLINSKDRPLGLYYFGTDKSEEDDLFNKTASGGVTVNNVISHIQQNDLSFGGVGPSGMGRYKSFDGFKNFSNPRAYYKEVGFKLDKFFDAVRPPYKGSIEKVLKQLMK